VVGQPAGRRRYYVEPQTVRLRSPPIQHIQGQAEVINGKLYLVGGEGGPTLEATTRLGVYDPATNTWTRAGMETRRMQFASGSSTASSTSRVDSIVVRQRRWGRPKCVTRRPIPDFQGTHAHASTWDGQRGRGRQTVRHPLRHLLPIPARRPTVLQAPSAGAPNELANPQAHRGNRT
jgi:hypothetical protein